MENQNYIAVDDELIARYLSGEADPEEADALHEWLENPANRNYFEGIKSAWDATLPSGKPREVNVSRAWITVNDQMQNEGAPSKTLLYLSAAASVILLIIAGLWYVNTRGAQPDVVILSTTDSTMEIRLPDHSAVILNRNSAFSYPESFKGEKREVNLTKGEGFFDVAAHANKPFVIHTNLGDIQVMGTAFNVIAHSSRLHVGVKQGQVMVYTRVDTALVGPGFSAEITAGKGSIKMAKQNDVNDWGYATGLFEFNDTPLDEVIAKLEKSFSCMIKPSNPEITRCKLTATFENVSLENMLSLMAETLNLSVTRNGKVFTLTGEGCP